ncbi:PilZ domain-containing protein [Dechloromonas sp. XY25]|uniref:PilZ domain-containing protein n=1 Tax=Dechloromonas hankyongensis TaxID=2908002 RepID=A0ABS9K2D7_9RHOO|nr:PilZ domain-containing protein [Dechloromonas hankyongensis]MCG2577342.1 PilZ domain-containing protein [Dechloromonas hankyongensis]
MKERRRASRVRLQGEVSLTLGGQTLTLPAADISVSGVGVLIDANILGGKPSGEVGICRIESPDLGGRIEAYVSVMRLRRIGNLRLVGLRFESISDEELELIHDYKRKRQGVPAAS